MFPIRKIHIPRPTNQSLFSPLEQGLIDRYPISKINIQGLIDRYPISKINIELGIIVTQLSLMPILSRAEGKHLYNNLHGHLWHGSLLVCRNVKGQGSIHHAHLSRDTYGGNNVNVVVT